MMAKSPRVAKVVITIENREDKNFVFSRKNAKGGQRYGRLEFLGGKIDKENPLCGLVRELCEEEKTGILACELCKQRPVPTVIKIDKTIHYIFEISITDDRYSQLEHDPKESLGFKVIPEFRLNEEEFESSLTKKTKKILKALDLM